jgi:hypothetical protein
MTSSMPMNRPRPRRSPTAGQPASPSRSVASALAPSRAFGQPVLPDRVDGRDPSGDVQCVRHEGRGDRVWLPGGHDVLRAENRRQREAAADALADGHQVRGHSLVLARPHPAAPPEAALDLIEYQHGAGLVGEPAQARQEAWRRYYHPAVALDRLDHDAGRGADARRRVVDQLLE